MSVAETPELSPSAPARSRGPVLALMVLGVLLVAAGVYWVVAGGQSSAAEADAAKQLEALGALVVKDGGGSYVASVNLSTIADAASLAKAVELLPKFGRLGAVDASRTAITDSQMSKVGQVASLESLAVSETSLTDEGAAQLTGLENLRSLNFSSTAITDDAASAISQLTSLKILDLSSTKITSNLAPLAELPALEWLVLRDVKLAEGALEKLGQSRSLQRLGIEGSQYPESSLAALLQQLPRLSVNK